MNGGAINGKFVIFDWYPVYLQLLNVGTYTPRIPTIKNAIPRDPNVTLLGPFIYKDSRVDGVRVWHTI